MQDISSMMDIHVNLPRRRKDPFSNRIAIIDFLRGILILLVVFDHLMYDFSAFFPDWFKILNISDGPFYDFVHEYIIDLSSEHNYFSCLAREIIRDTALAGFIFLSGVSCAFSRNNHNRAVKMVLFWLLMDLVMNLLHGFNKKLGLGFNDFALQYNVIAVIACCVLLYCLVEKKSPQYLFFVIVALVVVNFTLLPFLKEQLKDQPFLFYPLWQPDSIKVNGSYYHTVDYMPLFPYVIWFFIGALISKIAYEHPENHLSHNYNWMRPACFCGRHSLLIYIGHQIILYGIFIGISEIVRLVA